MEHLRVHSPTQTFDAGYWIIVAALAVFICIAGVRRSMSPYRWDSTTASIIAPADAQHRWPDGRLNLNTATAAELCILPGIGPARARAIIEGRQNFGPYRSLEELTRVQGIGAKTIEWFDEHVRIDPPACPPEASAD